LVPRNTRAAQAAPGGALPSRHTATPRQKPQRGRQLGVERPQLAAGRGIERDDAIERRAEHEPAVRQNRRDLEGAALESFAAALGFAGVIGPGDGEPADVLFRNLPRGGVARPADIAAVRGPLLRARRHDECQREQARQSKEDGLSAAQPIPSLGRSIAPTVHLASIQDLGGLRIVVAVTRVRRGAPAQPIPQNLCISGAACR